MVGIDCECFHKRQSSILLRLAHVGENTAVSLSGSGINAIKRLFAEAALSQTPMSSLPLIAWTGRRPDGLANFMTSFMKGVFILFDQSIAQVLTLIVSLFVFFSYESSDLNVRVGEFDFNQVI